MKRKALLAVVLALATSAAFAQQGPVPKGVPALSHVWVIMMENHGFVQVLNNPAAPFTTQYAAAANLGTNYFAVAHPSLTNYLERMAARTSESSTTTRPTGTTPVASRTWSRA